MIMPYHIYKARKARAKGIKKLLVGSYRPSESCCERKVKYSFNTASEAATNIWEEGHFLLVSTFAYTVGVTMSVIVKVKALVEERRNTVCGAATLSSQSGIGLNTR